MLEVVGKEMSDTGVDGGRGRVIITDKAKERCRQELLKVRG